MLVEWCYVAVNVVDGEMEVAEDTSELAFHRDLENCRTITPQQHDDDDDTRISLLPQRPNSIHLVQTLLMTAERVNAAPGCLSRDEAFIAHPHTHSPPASVFVTAPDWNVVSHPPITQNSHRIINNRHRPRRTFAGSPCPCSFIFPTRILEASICESEVVERTRYVSIFLAR